MSHEAHRDCGPYPECGKGDAVLARHLDGDLGSELDDGYVFACGETLHAHLCACAACQTLLRRARKLDAALAGAAGRSLADHVGDDASWQVLQARWFAAACAPARSGAVMQSGAVHEPVHESLTCSLAGALPEPPPESPADSSRAPALHVVVTAALTAAAAAALVPLLWPRGEQPDAGDCAARPAAVAPAIVMSPMPRAEMVPRAEMMPRAEIASTGADDAGPAEPAIDGAAADAGEWSLAPMTLAADAVQSWRRRTGPIEQAVLPAISPAAPTIAALAATFATAATSADRLAACKALVAAARPTAPSPRAAYRAAIEALAGCGDGDAMAMQLQRDALTAAREAPHVTAQLGAALLQLEAPSAVAGRDDLAAIVVASRLGTRELDALVRRVVRRHPATAAVVATALRSGARADGGAALLLDLWQDLAVRGESGNDDTAARAWFAGQPIATFEALAAELRTSRAEPRRQHCLLALGEADDGKSLAVLLEHVRSSHHAEAHAAAFALASLPRALLATVVPPAGDADGAFLLRAALARAGVAAAQPWLDALALRSTDLVRVHRCRLAEFPEVASWFRERGAGAAPSMEQRPGTEIL